MSLPAPWGRSGTPPESPWLVVFDVDSTVIEEEVIELLATQAGCLEEVAAITARAMAGDMDFAESLRQRVATLKGLPVEVFETVRSDIHPTLGVKETFDAIRQAGGTLGLLSGGFHEVIDPLAAALGVTLVSANRLGVIDGRLSGAVEPPIVDANGKACALRAWAERLGIPLERTVAVGDGANDLAMMALAGLSIAFNAKPRVAERAMVSITRRDMRLILPLFGLAPPESP